MTELMIDRLLLVEYAISCYSNGASKDDFMADVKSHRELNSEAWDEAHQLIRDLGLNDARINVCNRLHVHGIY